MSVSIGIHINDGTVVKAVDLTRFGEPNTPLVRIEFGDEGETNPANIYVSSHSDIDKILRALADAGRMIPVEIPAKVGA